MVDTTLFLKFYDYDILVVQIYVEDIVLTATNEKCCQELAKLMHNEFEMFLMGELSLFLRLQVEQTRNDIFVHQEKYIN